jgi:hypothetical protein
MNEVFILGAGFSKAISEVMPVTKELAAEVVERYRYRVLIPAQIRSMMEQDEGQGFERTLTFLAQDKPWLPEAENLRHKALYLVLVNVIRAIFVEKSRSSLVWGTNQPQLWLEALITYWHENRCAVITLNYDTLIERVASSVYWKNRPSPIPTGHLYPIVLTPAAQRSAASASGTGAAEKPMKTFRLFKLHGSVNWFFSGRSDFFGEQLYYVPCKGGLDGAFDADVGHDPEEHHWNRVGDKAPLIMPPALDKSPFFQHESLRSLWFQAGRAIAQATRIICLGYSMPASDLTMAQFLKTSAPPTPVQFEIANLSTRMDAHCASVLGAETLSVSTERFGPGLRSELCNPELRSGERGQNPRRSNDTVENAPRKEDRLLSTLGGPQ